MSMYIRAVFVPHCFVNWYNDATDVIQQLIFVVGTFRSGYEYKIATSTIHKPSAHSSGHRMTHRLVQNSTHCCK